MLGKICFFHLNTTHVFFCRLCTNINTTIECVCHWLWIALYYLLIGHAYAIYVQVFFPQKGNLWIHVQINDEKKWITLLIQNSTISIWNILLCFVRFMCEFSPLTTLCFSDGLDALSFSISSLTLIGMLAAITYTVSFS